jgi:hypothetical protein
MINSNNILPSQLAGESKWDLGKLPQIKHLVFKSENLLANTQENRSKIGKSYSNDFKAIKHIYNPEFWTKLIKLYIIHYSRIETVFYLKNFDLSTISQPLLNAVYCLGYLYFDQKSDELTEYMDKFENRNYQRIRFKPSLANIQALFIHQNIIYNQGNVSEARAILLHITKMCYMLGLHRKTKRTSKSAIYTRNLIYTKILYLHLIMSKVYKVNLNFKVDTPDIKNLFYDLEWHLLPKETAQLINFNEDEKKLIATTIILGNELIDRALLQLVFPTMDSYTNEQIYKLCMNKWSSLQLIRFKCVSGYELALNNFPEYSELISFDMEAIDACYLHVGILIFDYGKSKSKGVNYRLVNKMINLCDKIMEIAVNSDTGSFFEFVFYLAAFTYIFLFKQLKRSQQKKLTSNLSVFKRLFFNNLNNSNLLIYLLFDKGIEFIKNL